MACLVCPTIDVSEELVFFGLVNAYSVAKCVLCDEADYVFYNLTEAFRFLN